MFYPNISWHILNTPDHLPSCFSRHNVPYFALVHKYFTSILTLLTSTLTLKKPPPPTLKRESEI